MDKKFLKLSVGVFFISCLIFLSLPQVFAYTDNVSNVRFDVSPTESPLIIVDLWNFRLNFIENGYLVRTYPVATGMPSTPTPVAQWIVGIKTVRPPTAIMSARHLRLFRLSAGGYQYTGFAIHGTPWPWTIGTRASHGCIRMYNGDVIDLYPRAGINTKVITTNLPSQYDMRLWGNYDGRLWGKTASATAVAISQEGWRQAKVVLLARADYFSDGLAASSLAATFKNNPGAEMPAPLLLTSPDSLSSETLEEMKRLGAETAIVLGGPGAISENVVRELQQSGITTDRIYGETSYGTAADVARRMSTYAREWGTFSPPDTAVIVNGLNFQDALSASGAAAFNNMPVLLTAPNSLSSETNQALEDLAIKRVIVIGGPAVISDQVILNLQQKGVEIVARFWGEDQYETAIKVATDGNQYFHFSQPGPIFVARGDYFADGLAAGVLASRFGVPILLTEPSQLPISIRAYLTNNRALILSAYILGGPGAISETVESEVRNILK